MKSKRIKRIGFILCLVGVVLMLSLGSFFYLSLKPGFLNRSIRNSVLGMDKEMLSLIEGGLNHDELAKSQTGLTIFMNDTLVYWNCNDVNPKLMAPDSQGINDGEGADIVCPVCTISETHWFRPSKITTAWKKKVATMVGCINGSAFWGFSAGELLFTGCSGTRTGDSSKDKWQVTFRFGVQANQSVKIGSLGTISKRGWDLLWARYKEEIKESGGKKIVLRVPKAAYAEQVYEEANFKSLGI